MTDEAVKKGTIEVRYSIYEYDVDGDKMYDWYGEDDEADQLFESIEEAEADARRHFGG